MPEVAPPDLIEVTATVEDELAADHADLHVTVAGSSFVTGTAALGKAREVSALVAAVRAEGVAEKDIRLESAYAQVTSGLLSKSSSATYALAIRCRDLEKLGDVLGAITGQKNVTLGNIEWGFPEDDARRNAWLAAASEKALARAQAIAKPLGVRIAGVHRFYEGERSVREAYDSLGAPGGGAYKSSVPRMRGADLGLAISHTRKIEVKVTVAFRVAAGS